MISKRPTGRFVVGLALTTFLLAGCGSEESAAPANSDARAGGAPGATAQWGIVIHGGAGTISRESMTDEQETAYRAALELSLQRGHAILAEGGSALDAVVAAVQVMEDDSIFNAGRGAVFTNDGRNELDAAIMDGATLNAGAVAGVTTVRSPIALARAVMEESEHVFLAGAGADAFAETEGLEIVDPSYFRTQRRWDALQRARGRDGEDPIPDRAAFLEYSSPNHDRFGTVGAVALDPSGQVAAATSTGGRTNKRWGRVGDVPVIGAGTYANADCAVSGTGWGEYFIMNTVARDICMRMEFEGITLQAAADRLIQDILPPQADDTGGVIAISSSGELVWSFNTPGMYRGRIDQDGNITLGIYGEDG